MKTIMLVSDKTFDFSNFIRPLKQKYPVDAMAYISTARYKLEKAIERYNLIIIEIKMVTLGEFSLEETDNGYITGIVWYRKELANLGLPVIFWGYEDPNHESEVEKLKTEFPNNKIGYIQRENFEDDHLVDGVEKFL